MHKGAGRNRKRNRNRNRGPQSSTKRRDLDRCDRISPKGETGEGFELIAETFIYVLGINIGRRSCEGPGGGRERWFARFRDVLVFFLLFPSRSRTSPRLYSRQLFNLNTKRSTRWKEISSTTIVAYLHAHATIFFSIPTNDTSMCKHAGVRVS